MLRTPCIHIFILIAFIINSFGPITTVAQAQASSPAIGGDFNLPMPGVMVRLSPPIDPPMLKGIKVNPNDPFHFDFILDQGDNELSRTQLKDESNKLIKYFLASLTVPEKDLWVNLSPYEKNRIIPNSFGLTEMGRDLLAEDYMLKQITASIIYPEDVLGKKFWKRVYEEAARKYGTTNVPVNTFNKVWVVPEKAVVYENEKAGTAYVVESRLKVMLEEDYLSMLKSSQGIPSSTNALGSQIVREIVIPELTKEVNENKNFIKLRQVYNSLILATWYKMKIKDSILSQVYADKSKVAGVNIDDPKEKDRIYQQYLKAFKKGVYNYIKEDLDPLSQEMIPRKYFSGGFNLAMRTSKVLKITYDTAMVSNRKDSSRILLSIDTRLALPGRVASDKAMNAQKVMEIMSNENFQRRIGDVVQHLVINGVESRFHASAQGEMTSVWKGSNVTTASLNSGSVVRVLNKKERELQNAERGISDDIDVHSHPWGLFGRIVHMPPTPSDGDLLSWKTGGTKYALIVWGEVRLGFYASLYEVDKLGDYKEADNQHWGERGVMVNLYNQGAARFFRLVPAGGHSSFGDDINPGSLGFIPQEIDINDAFSRQMEFENSADFLAGRQKRRLERFENRYFEKAKTMTENDLRDELEAGTLSLLLKDFQRGLTTTSSAWHSKENLVHEIRQQVARLNGFIRWVNQNDQMRNNFSGELKSAEDLINTVDAILSSGFGVVSASSTLLDKAMSSGNQIEIFKNEELGYELFKKRGLPEDLARERINPQATKKASDVLRRVKDKINGFTFLSEAQRKAVDALDIIASDEVNTFGSIIIGFHNGGRPLILINSKVIDALNDAELLYVIGHEVGHELLADVEIELSRGNYGQLERRRIKALIEDRCDVLGILVLKALAGEMGSVLDIYAKLGSLTIPGESQYDIYDDPYRKDSVRLDFLKSLFSQAEDRLIGLFNDTWPASYKSKKREMPVIDKSDLNQMIQEIIDNPTPVKDKGVIRRNGLVGYSFMFEKGRELTITRVDDGINQYTQVVFSVGAENLVLSPDGMNDRSEIFSRQENEIGVRAQTDLPSNRDLVNADGSLSDAVKRFFPVLGADGIWKARDSAMTTDDIQKIQNTYGVLNITADHVGREIMAKRIDERFGQIKKWRDDNRRKSNLDLQGALGEINRFLQITHGLVEDLNVISDYTRAQIGIHETANLTVMVDGKLESSKGMKQLHLEGTDILLRDPDDKLRKLTSLIVGLRGGFEKLKNVLPMNQNMNYLQTVEVVYDNFQVYQRMIQDILHPEQIDENDSRSGYESEGLPEYIYTYFLIPAKKHLKDQAMKSSLIPEGQSAKNVGNTGGIDLTPANMHLQLKNGDSTGAFGGIKFLLDPAILAQIQNAPGFVPVIINIQPMTDLPRFLGLEVKEASQVTA